MTKKKIGEELSSPEQSESSISVTTQELSNPTTLKALAEIAKEKERLRGRLLEDISAYERFASVRSEVKVLAKGGVNSHSNYKYAREADIVAQVNISCEAHGLYYIIEYYNAQYSIVERNGKVSVRASVDCKLTIIDTITGKTVHTNTACGDALDSGDKAIFKAQTGAKKYAMMAMFGIATFDDPEVESPTIDGDKKPIGLTRFEYQIPKKTYEGSEKLKGYINTKKYTPNITENWVVINLATADINLQQFKKDV